ncbi:MAG: M20 family metallopeptidase [Clostridiales bacterium]
MDYPFLKAAKAIEPQLIEWRRCLHQNAEIGFDLPLTTTFVKSKLREFGYEPKTVGKAGITATVGKPGPVILLRADMDALPITEESGLPFACTNGNCHACGHDFHTTALLGAAKLLKEYEDRLPGMVLLVFQACEEGLDGMQDMLNHGLLDDPKPQAAFAMHTIQEKTGTAGIHRGYAGASSDVFTITVTGLGSHGAVPERGVDPINAAAHIITSLQALNSREVAPDQMLVVTICKIQAGSAHNIIPGTCTLGGTIRTADKTVRQFATKRLVEISQGVAAAFRATAEVKYEGGVPPMISDPAFAGECAGYIDEILGYQASWQIPPMTGSEDFSLLCDHLPSVLCWFGTGNQDEGYKHSGHHPAVTYNEEALHQMAAVYAGCAARWLAEH